MEFRILYFIQSLRRKNTDYIMLFFSSLGSKGFIWIALCLLLLRDKKTRSCGINVGASLIFSAILCNILLKNIFARPRPCWIDNVVKLPLKKPLDYSFPSGHTSAAFAASFAIMKFYNQRALLKSYFVQTK